MTKLITNYDQIWQTTLGELEVVLSKPSFITWFKQTFILEIHDQTVIIGVPTNFALEWLRSKYQTHILEVLRRLIPDQHLQTIGFKIAQQSAQQVAPSPLPSPTIKELESPPRPTVAPHQFSEGNPPIPHTYTFDNFIVGTHNRLAHAASLAVASEPGTRHNPLFIYGGVGLGKTHLVYAIGNDIAARFPKKRILYASCERFANEFIHAIQTKRMEAFKERYRTVDVLLIDDIQFLAGKEGTQEEFFHTFNALHQTN